MNTLNPTSRSRRSPAIFTLAFSLMVSGLLLQACASSPKPAPQSGPVELDKTKWKLLSLAGSLDGRVVEFTKRGADGYEGKLVDMGKRLRDVVGLDVGFVMFQLKRRSDNEFAGTYTDPKAGNATKEVVVFIDGNNMSWNQESAVWERQE